MNVTQIFWILAVICMAVGFATIVVDIVEHSRVRQTHKYTPLVVFSVVLSIIFALTATVWANHTGN